MHLICRFSVCPQCCIIQLMTKIEELIFGHGLSSVTTAKPLQKTKLIREYWYWSAQNQELIGMILCSVDLYIVQNWLWSTWNFLFVWLWKWIPKSGRFWSILNWVEYMFRLLPEIFTWNFQIFSRLYDQPLWSWIQIQII